MPLIRPEAAAALWRGREMLAGGGVAVLGLWASWDSFGLLRWLGIALLLVGLGVMAAGWQRWRLRPRAEGLGVVEADEARITYWGPLDGGSVARDALTRLAIDRTGHPAVWVLSHEAGPDLHVPVTAAGQDALFDALAGLPGLRAGALIAARQAEGTGTTVIWQPEVSVDTLARSPHL